MMGRGYCGRTHRRPWHARLTDLLGYHRELFYYKGEVRLRTRWVASQRPGRSVYTCRLPPGHWVFVLKQPGWRTMTQIAVKNRVKRSQRPVFSFEKPVQVQVPTPSWELGHRYQFTRWEDL